MRYYKLVITNPATGKPVLPSSLGNLGITSLATNGLSNPGALNVEFDIPVALYSLPGEGGALVRVWGLSLLDLSHAFDLNGMSIAVYGGMQRGLPLANPRQSGLLVKGQIFQAFGNWIGIDQTLDMILAPATGSLAEPKNLILNWRAGTKLSDAIATTFKTALPDAKQQINISDKLVLPNDEIGYASTLSEYAGTVRTLSRSIISAASYPGVSIAYNGAVLTVTDSTPAKTKAIEFQDMIGQPTWRGPAQIQVKLVMRADLELLDAVTLPRSLITSTAQSLTRLRDSSAFTGRYQITNIHHFGNFRQPDAASWNTTIDMTPEIKAA